MALDLGEKRIGVAFSDPTRTIAQAYTVLRRKSRLEDFQRYQQIITDQKITLLVVGLPVTLSGEDSDQTRWVRDYTTEMRNHLDIPIEFWDEGLTTIQAADSLRIRGKRGKKARERIDAVAAAFICQSYLDAHAEQS